MAFKKILFEKMKIYWQIRMPFTEKYYWISKLLKNQEILAHLNRPRCAQIFEKVLTFLPKKESKWGSVVIWYLALFNSEWVLLKGKCGVQIFLSDTTDSAWPDLI